MESKNFFIKVKNAMKSERAYKVVHNIIFFIFITITANLLFLKTDGYIEGSVSLSDFDFSYLNLPMIVLSAIGGFIPSIISFFSLFLVELFSRSDVAYSSFAYLVTICISYLFARNGVYRRFLKTIISVPVFTIVLGVVWFVINEVMNMRGFINVNADTVLKYVMETFPEVFGGSVIAFLWYRFIPENVKAIFRFGLYDTTRFKAFIDEKKMGKKAEKRTWISAKISRIIMIEALILGLSAAVFSVILINDMGDDLVPAEGEGDGFDISLPEDAPETEDSPENSSENESLPENGSENENEESAIRAEMDEYMHQRREQVRLNNNNLAFAMRLIMLLLNMAIPIAILADTYAQMVIARPIRRMAIAMKSFTEADDENKDEELEKVHSLSIKSRDEIQELYEYMDGMVDSIVEFEEHLKEEQKLQEDLRVAEKASKAKSDFLSSMSHEIRTPINAVLGLDEMILRETEDETVLSYAVDIQNAGHSLLSLVNDILDFSKIEAGKMDIIPVDYELSSTINDLTNMIAVRAEKKGLSLVIDVNKEIPHLLFGDEVRIKQVVTNILTNAVKYTKKGSVTMKVDYEKTGVNEIGLFFSVKDTGIGMKEEDLKKLYSPFERIEEKRNRSIEGTGLGMSIVKQLLDKMGTKLTVTSVYGEGSEFSFTVSQEVKKWEPIGDYTATYQKAIKDKSRNKYKESFTAPDCEILITDDTRMNLTVVIALLKKTRIKIDTATSGRETLDKVKKKRYDVIFLDHMMPEMDGIETLKNMKELSDNLCKDTPVIALTANAVSGAREEYIKAGFNDYLTKPVDGERLEKMLIDYLPKDKVFLTGDEREAAGSLEETPDDTESAVKKIEGIDCDEAVKNCGSYDTAMEIMKEYLESIDEKSDLIEKYFNEEDYKNYKVLVHALKSSSRLIGAKELSEMARDLEKAANEEDIDKIKSDTGELLELYRSYKDKLSCLSCDAGDCLPEIPLDEFEGAMKTIAELVSAFDFDSADDVILMLKDYVVPKEKESLFNDVKKAVKDVDREKVLSLLN